MARRSRNLSVRQFQQLMDRIPKEVAAELRGAVQDGAEDIARTMRSTVSLGIDGRNELQESIRVEDGRHPLRVLIKAGGPLTTKEVREGSGVSYDYALANEFGTQKMTAQPFFWPSYRLRKKPVRSKIARRARKAIAKVVPLK